MTKTKNTDKQTSKLITNHSAILIFFLYLLQVNLLLTINNREMPHLLTLNSILEDFTSSKLVTILSIALIAVLVLLVKSIVNALKLEKERKKLEK